MRRFLKNAGVALLLLVILAGAIAAWGWHELRANGVRIREAYAAGLAQIRPAFLKDQELARRYPVLGPAGRERDAGPVLNPRIGWDGDPNRVAGWRAQLPGTSQPLKLGQSVVDAIPAEWMATPPEVWKGLDFAWMAELAPFDHWDVESNSPWAEATAGEWPGGFPSFMQLIPWAKLRLAKGLAGGSLAEAAAEVEHLAALVLSTETTLGAAQWLQILSLLDEATAVAVRQGGTAPALLSRMDGDTRARVFRAAMAARYFLLAETPEAYRGETDRILIGRCAAMNEALNFALLVRDSAGRRREELLHWIPLDGAFARSCRLTRVRRELAALSTIRPESDEHQCEQTLLGSSRLCRVLLLLPLTRTVERSFAREVLTQMDLANVPVESWYRERPAPEAPFHDPSR